MKYSIVLLVNLYLFWVILDTEFLFFFFKKNTMCVFWKKIIDVKISSGYQFFSQHWICYLLPKKKKKKTSRLSLSVYIWGPFFKKKKKKKKNIIAWFLRFKKNKERHFQKLRSFQEGTRISNEDVWKYFCKPSVWAARKYLWWELFSFFLLLGLLLVFFCLFVSFCVWFDFLLCFDL